MYAVCNTKFARAGSDLTYSKNQFCWSVILYKLIQ